MAGPIYRQVERQARRMHDMMDRLDVDAVKLARMDEGRAYAQARTRCFNCRETDKCLEWLDAAETPKERPDFCPNLRLFDFLTERQDA